MLLRLPPALAVVPLFLFEAPVGSFLHTFDLSWALLAGAYAVPATQDPRCSWHGPAGKLRGRGRALVMHWNGEGRTMGMWGSPKDRAV